MGKRERKAVVRGQHFTVMHRNGKVQPPFRIPRMEQWQFFDQHAIHRCYERELSHARRMARLREASYGSEIPPAIKVRVA